jgi:hypothetical protein
MMTSRVLSSMRCASMSWTAIIESEQYFFDEGPFCSVI